MNLVNVLCGAPSCTRVLVLVRTGDLGEVVVRAVPRSKDKSENKALTEVSYRLAELAEGPMFLECDRHGQRIVDGSALVRAVLGAAKVGKKKILLSQPAPGGGRTKAFQ